MQVWLWNHNYLQTYKHAYMHLYFLLIETNIWEGGALFRFIYLLNSVKRVPACAIQRFNKQYVLYAQIRTCVHLCRRNHHWIRDALGNSASQSSKSQLPISRMHILVFISYCTNWMRVYTKIKAIKIKEWKSIIKTDKRWINK